MRTLNNPGAGPLHTHASSRMTFVSLPRQNATGYEQKRYTSRTQRRNNGSLTGLKPSRAVAAAHQSAGRCGVAAHGTTVTSRGAGHCPVFLDVSPSTSGAIVMGRPIFWRRDMRALDVPNVAVSPQFWRGVLFAVGISLPVWAVIGGALWLL